jgi:hypothetical protein
MNTDSKAEEAMTEQKQPDELKDFSLEYAKEQLRLIGVVGLCDHQVCEYYAWIQSVMNPLLDEAFALRERAERAEATNEHHRRVHQRLIDHTSDMWVPVFLGAIIAGDDIDTAMQKAESWRGESVADLRERLQATERDRDEARAVIKAYYQGADASLGNWNLENCPYDNGTELEHAWKWGFQKLEDLQELQITKTIVTRLTAQVAQKEGEIEEMRRQQADLKARLEKEAIESDGDAALRLIQYHKWEFEKVCKQRDELALIVSDNRYPDTGAKIIRELQSEVAAANQRADEAEGERDKAKEALRNYLASTAITTVKNKGRCAVTGNDCGTDTWQVGYSCQCSNCQIYVAQTEGRQAKEQATDRWLPIDSAPKDGSEVLIYSMGDMGICYWRDDDTMIGWTWGMGMRFWNPTHWQPLPARPMPIPAPAAATTEGKGESDE